MANAGVSRYKCIGRFDKKTITGKTDYKDRYFYRILDTQSGKTVMFTGNDLKREMGNGTKIDGLELTVDGRIMFKDLKNAQTVITPSTTKTGKISKKTSQCVDLSLAAEYLCNNCSGLNYLMGAQTLRIMNCGYGTIEHTANKAKMMGGYVFNIGHQKVIISKTKDILTLFAEKWVYSNRSSYSRYSYGDIGKIGMLAKTFGVEHIEINNIQFVTESLSNAFSSTSGGRLKSIRIINSDMSYIKSMEWFCVGQPLEKLEILGTSLDNVITMRNAFSGPITSDETLVLNIPDTPRLQKVDGMFWGYSNKSLPDLKFMHNAKIKSAVNMFAESHLVDIDLSDLDFTECEDVGEMFRSCGDLKHVTFGSKPMTRLKVANQMFEDCNNIMTIDIMCINSPGLKMANEDYLPRSEFYNSGKHTRTYQIFKGINPHAKIRMNTELLDIIKSNRA